VALTPAALVLLDLMGAALAVVIAAFFAASWRRSGDNTHLLFMVGFLLLAGGVAASSTSQFDLQRPAEAWDALRVAAHTSGALVLAFAYLSASRHGDARPWTVVGWVAAGMGLLFAVLYWLVPPSAALPSLTSASFAAHAVQFVAYAACVALSLEGFRRRPALDNALVPTAFLAWAFSKYTWLLIDVSADTALVPFVLVWRFAALGLLLLALALPPPIPAGGEDAAPA
jgi:hypothetical protein